MSHLDAARTISGGALKALPWPAAPEPGPNPTGVAPPPSDEAAIAPSAHMTREEYGDAFSRGYQLTASMLRTLGATSSDASEIAQEAWARGWVHLSHLRDKRRVRAWVNSIARNQLVSALRHERHLCPLSAANDRVVATAISLAAIELNRVLQMCTKRQRQLLESVYLQGYSASDLAERSGQSLGSVHSRVSRALHAVRKYIGYSDSKTTVDGTKTEAIKKSYGTSRKSS